MSDQTDTQLPPAPPPPPCPLCEIWKRLPYMKRPSTAVEVREVGNVYTLGYWVAQRQPPGLELCPHHKWEMAQFDKVEAQLRQEALAKQREEEIKRRLAENRGEITPAHNLLGGNQE